LLGNSLITLITTTTSTSTSTIRNQSISISITGYYLVYPSLLNSSFMMFHYSFLSFYTFLITHRKLALMSFLNWTVSISKNNLYDDPSFFFFFFLLLSMFNMSSTSELNHVSLWTCNLVKKRRRWDLCSTYIESFWNLYLFFFFGLMCMLASG
jgi:hypothetical protein